MQETDLHYPPDACPFCGIAAAYPVKDSGLWNKKQELQDAVPSDQECDVEKTSPSSFLVMRTRDVVAFLDILPMTGGKFITLGMIGGLRVRQAWRDRRSVYGDEAIR